jgi:hypothetical protein
MSGKAKRAPIISVTKDGAKDYPPHADPIDLCDLVLMTSNFIFVFNGSISAQDVNCHADEGQFQRRRL